MTVDTTKTLGESSSVAELEAKLEDLKQQRAVAQSRVDELTKRRASLVVPALAESDTAAAAQIDAIDEQLAAENRKSRDLETVIVHIDGLLPAAREREREARAAEADAELDELEAKLSKAAAAVVDAAEKELRPQVAKLQRLMARYHAVSARLETAGGDARHSPVSLEAIVLEVCASAGLPIPPTRRALWEAQNEGIRGEAASFQAGRMAGRREVTEGSGPTPFRGVR